MALFAIADLHFAFSVDKPMDIFGENWKNHSEKIIASWKKYIPFFCRETFPGGCGLMKRRQIWM